MCSIFGLVSVDSINSSDLEDVLAVGNQMLHRGPDDLKVQSSQNFSIGMTRLSIVDIENGQQPLTNESGSIKLFFNGEIYNQIELKNMLKSNHEFKGKSDGEILVHLYEEYGMSFLTKIEGMFAFTLIDQFSDTIYFARDKFGEKPLYIYQDHRRFLFSSELKPLLVSRLVPLIVDYAHVIDYLKHGFVTEPNCIVKDVRTLSPGSYEKVQIINGTVNVENFEYWNAKDLLDSASSHRHDSIESDLKQVLTTGIISKLQADVPIGVALSSGLDSSIICALTAERYSEVKAFTIGYENSHGSDEIEGSQKLTQSLNVSQVSKKIQIGEVGALFSEVCLSRDEPIADISGLSYLMLGKLAKANNVKVLLTGQGLDEFFWGYSWSKSAYSRNLRRLSTFKGEQNFFDYLEFNIPERSMRGIVKSLLQGFNLYSNLADYFADRKDARKSNHGGHFFGFRFNSKKYSTRISKISSEKAMSIYKAEFQLSSIQALRFDLINTVTKTYLRTNGLMQVDRMFMRSSVEGRSPYVDANILKIALEATNCELCFEELIRSNKSLLHRSFGDLVPGISKKKTKIAFKPPLKLWYQEIYRFHQSEFRAPLLVKLGLGNRKLTKLLNKPTDLIGRVSVLWLELAVLEIWLRGIEAEAKSKWQVYKAT